MVAFFAPLFLIRTRSELKQLAVVLVALSTVISLTAVGTTRGGTPLSIPGSVDEIDLALYASLGMFAAFAYLPLVYRGIWRLLWLVPAGVCGSTVISAGSRGVLLASLTAVLVVGGFVVARARQKLMTAMALATVLVTLAVLLPQLAGGAAQKYQQGLFSGDSAQVLGQRSFLLRDGLTIALAHPLGTGVGGYQFLTGEVYPHNALLEAADEQGIIGAALLAWVLVAAGLAIRRAAPGRASPEAVFASALWVAMVGEAMFSTSFTTNRVLWFALGLAFAVPQLVVANRGGRGASAQHAPQPPLAAPAGAPGPSPRDVPPGRQPAPAMPGRAD
jgi:hypothetical protein